jgi:hypothetical protein
MDQKENLSDGEREMMGLHDFILSAFRKELGDTVIGVNLLPLVHECWATVVVKEKSPEIEKMAREIELEFREELGRHISVFIKVPLKNRIQRLASSIWKI